MGENGNILLEVNELEQQAAQTNHPAGRSTRFTNFVKQFFRWPPASLVVELSAETTSQVSSTAALPPPNNELGKSLLNVAVPVLLSMVTNGAKSHNTPLVLAVLSVGCVAIWNGTALRGSFPKMANFIEQLGILMVLMSFNGLVASALPVAYVWVPILCGCFCVVPFVLGRWK